MSTGKQLISLVAETVGLTSQAQTVELSVSLSHGCFEDDSGRVEFRHRLSDGRTETFEYSFASMGSVWLMHLGGVLGSCARPNEPVGYVDPGQKNPHVVFDVPHPGWIDGNAVKIVVFAQTPKRSSPQALDESIIELVFLYSIGSTNSHDGLDYPRFLFRRVYLRRETVALQGQAMAEKIMKERTEGIAKKASRLHEVGLERYLEERGYERSQADPVMSLEELYFYKYTM